MKSEPCGRHGKQRLSVTQRVTQSLKFKYFLPWFALATNCVMCSVTVSYGVLIWTTNTARLTGRDVVTLWKRHAILASSAPDRNVCSHVRRALRRKTIPCWTIGTIPAICFIAIDSSYLIPVARWACFWQLSIKKTWLSIVKHSAGVFPFLGADGH